MNLLPEKEKSEHEKGGRWDVQEGSACQSVSSKTNNLSSTARPHRVGGRPLKSGPLTSTQLLRHHTLRCIHTQEISVQNRGSETA